jgi:hypothetical protein
MWLWIVACAHRPAVGETRWATPDGDLVMTCALDTCNLAIDGEGRPRPVASDLWVLGDVRRSVRQPIHGIWLLEVTDGDACPSMYRMICLESGKITGEFGNCNEVASTLEGPPPFVRFDATAEADRHAKVYRLDPAACEVLEVHAGD